MTKPGAEGYGRFVTSEEVRKLKEVRMPEIEREWARLPEGFRVMIFRNAGIDTGRLPRGLVGLSQEERRKLQAANARMSEMQTKAARLLIGAVYESVRSAG